MGVMRNREFASSRPDASRQAPRLLLQHHCQPAARVDAVSAAEAEERGNLPPVLQVVLQVLLNEAMLVGMRSLDPLVAHVGMVVEIDGDELLHGTSPERRT